MVTSLDPDEIKRVKLHPRIILFIVLVTMVWASNAFAGIEKIYVLNEIDDDHIIIVTQSGEQLLLEKWDLKFSPLLFEGKHFIADVSPMWVTIYIDGRDPIKWSVEENLGSFSPPGSKVPSQPKEKKGTTTRKGASQECYKTGIREPSPFLGNGGEIIILVDGTIWKEVSYQYLYLYEYHPTVIICPSSGKMILGEYVFEVIPVK